MNSRGPSRLGSVISALSVVIVAISAITFGQARPATAQQTFEKYTAKTVNLTPGAGETLTIQVLNWSMDADRDKALAAFADKQEKGLHAFLEAGQTLGYIWTRESLG